LSGLGGLPGLFLFRHGAQALAEFDYTIFPATASALQAKQFGVLFPGAGIDDDLLHQIQESRFLQVGELSPKKSLFRGVDLVEIPENIESIGEKNDIEASLSPGLVFLATNFRCCSRALFMNMGQN
jgi:hypothetical protein